MARKRAVKKKGVDKGPSALQTRISGLRDRLISDRYHGTVGQKRKEYTKKLGYLVDTLRGRERHEHLPAMVFSGLKKLNQEEVQEIKHHSAKVFRRLKRKLPTLELHVDVKRHHVKGKRSKYSITLRLEGQHSVVVRASQADWDLAKAMHKALANLEQQAKSKFKHEGHKHRKKKF